MQRRPQTWRQTYLEPPDTSAYTQEINLALNKNEYENYVENLHKNNENTYISVSAVNAFTLEM